MNQPNVESFLNKLHLDPTFELKVKDAVVASLQQFDLGAVESDLLFSEGIARLELAAIKRHASLGNSTPRPPPKPKKPKKPVKAPPKPKKKPAKPKKK